MKDVRPDPDPGLEVAVAETSDSIGDAADVVDLGQVVRPPADGRGPLAAGPLAIAGAIAVLVGGILLANQPVTVGDPPSPSPVVSDPAASATTWPAGSSPARTSPPRVPPACTIPSSFVPTEIELRWHSGVWTPVVLRELADEPSRREDWTDLLDRIGEVPAMRVDDLGRIDLGTSADLCLSGWSVTYVRIDGHGVLQKIGGGGGTLDPLRAAVTFVAPPVGDWLIVAMVVRYGRDGQLSWIESIARITVGDWPTGPDVVVRPVVPCGPDDLEPGAVLLIDGAPVEPIIVGPGAEPPVGTTLHGVPLGATVLMATKDDRCAVRWAIDIIPRPDQGGDRGPETLASYDNAVLDPAVAAQNRFPLWVGPSGGEWDLVGRFTFVDGATLDVAWPLRVEPFVPPSLRVSRQGHTRFANAWIGCGLSMSLRNGYETSDSCGSNLPRESLETLVVQPGERLTFDAGEWTTIDHWYTSAGAFRGDPANFEESSDGFLRSASSPPVDFPAPLTVGVWTLQLGTCVGRDGNSICGSWYVNVDVR